MKLSTLGALLIFPTILFSFVHCKKNKSDSRDLPATNQEGKNTLGFLLNGQQLINGYTTTLSATFNGGVTYKKMDMKWYELYFMDD